MALEESIRSTLTLPAFCAPMFLVSTPALVTAACRAGVIGGLPRQNVRTLEQYDSWLGQITRDLAEYRVDHPAARIAPVAANLATRMDAAETIDHLAVCERHGVRIVVTATGDPSELIKRVHDWGGLVFHDVTGIRHAEKAIKAGADGLTCIGSGGGGHSGTISHLALIPRIRTMFDGTIVMAGGVSTGAAIRAAEMLGADLAYLGTRFIATQESGAREAYKQLLVSQDSSGLRFTGAVSGVAANWLLESLRMAGLDPDDLPEPLRPMSHDHLPPSAKPWKNIWSAGQGIELIEDIPPVAELVHRLRQEYIAACALPDMAVAAQLAEDAEQAVGDLD